MLCCQNAVDFESGEGMKKGKKDILMLYLSWPLILGLVFLLAAVYGLIRDPKTGLLMLYAAAAYYLAAFVLWLLMRKKLNRRLVLFGASYAQVQNQLLRQVSIPFAMCEEDGTLIWSNPAFEQLFPEKHSLLSAFFPEMENADFARKSSYEISYKDQKYILKVSRLEADSESLNLVGGAGKDMRLYNVYLVDETDLVYYRRALEEEQSVMMLIFVDNYEEVMESVEYVRRSLLDALIERKLNHYVTSSHGLIRKMEKDRYLVVMKQKDLAAMEEDKFSLLDDIKTVNIGNEMAVTLSIGAGTGANTLLEDYQHARQAIDMALGRGGDQVVMRIGDEVRYFGGKSQSTERTTRVKARIKAHALRELIDTKEKLIIMGHPMSDLDAVGAAIGIYRAAKFSGKRAYIVINEITKSLEPLIDTFRNKDYEEDLFIRNDRALELFNNDTLLVVVDSNRPSYTECPDLLKRAANNVVVMDHHRQGRERIENALLSYVEPYASSASEMVAEMVQYYDDGLKLRSQEADALLAGIVMDTNNFVNKAGVRTFEAAAYLRRNGADVTRVRKMFREGLNDYMLRAETVSQAEMFLDDFIISICPRRHYNQNQTTIAAQAANELLEIRGVKASFVLTEYDDKIYVSARSIDEVNVQIIMEKLGGGGHLSMAGAQFEGIKMPEAVEKLKAALTEFKEENQNH